MSHHPTQYGISANFKKSTKPKNPNPEPDTAKPDTEQIKLSVMKGLWFPILTNLTKLMMENSSEQKLFSMEIFFRVLDHGIDAFDLNFWQEILSQVLYPMLKDIDLRTQDLQDDELGKFYLTTI